MRNWSVNTKKLRTNKKQYAVWKLESLINFGLGKKKISEKDLRKNIKNLHIDGQKSSFLKLILSGR